MRHTYNSEYEIDRRIARIDQGLIAIIKANKTDWFYEYTDFPSLIDDLLYHYANSHNYRRAHILNIYALFQELYSDYGEYRFWGEGFGDEGRIHRRTELRVGAFRYRTSTGIMPEGIKLDGKFNPSLNRGNSWENPLGSCTLTLLECLLYNQYTFDNFPVLGPEEALYFKGDIQTQTPPTIRKAFLNHGFHEIDNLEDTCCLDFSRYMRRLLKTPDNKPEQVWIEKSEPAFIESEESLQSDSDSGSFPRTIISGEAEEDNKPDEGNEILIRETIMDYLEPFKSKFQSEKHYQGAVGILEAYFKGEKPKIAEPYKVRAHKTKLAPALGVLHFQEKGNMPNKDYLELLIKLFNIFENENIDNPDVTRTNLYKYLIKGLK